MILKPRNLQLYYKLFQKGSTVDSEQVFSYLIQFLITNATRLFYRIYFMAACEIGTKADGKY